MAEKLEYHPHIDTSVSAREELEALIETLHASGTLRVLMGFFGRFDDVSEVALEQLLTDEGQHAMANLTVLAKPLLHVDPDHMQAFQEGTEKGLGAASESIKDEPPGLLSLIRQLNDPDTRRGLYAALTLLQTLGRHLHENLDGE